MTGDQAVKDKDLCLLYSGMTADQTIKYKKFL